MKGLKKSQLYLLTTLMGILLISIGIILLIHVIEDNERSQIIIKSVLLFFWVLFTVSNVLLYKKEKQKEKVV